MSVIEKSPFADAVGPNAVPRKGSAGGKYDSAEIPGGPSRDGGFVPELHRDTHFGEPKQSGPIVKSPFADAVS